MITYVSIRYNNLRGKMENKIYQHNLSKLSDKEFAQEAKRIEAIRKNDPEHAASLWKAWKIELDKRHPLVIA